MTSTRTAQRLIFPEPGRVAWEPMALGLSTPRSMVIRTVQSGISHGTEMAGFLGTSPFVTRTFTGERTFRDRSADDPPFYPFRYAGYDSVGVVEQVGDAVERYAVGDRVWLATPHQDYHVVEAGDPQVLPLPAGVDDDQAVMLNLAAIALAAVHDAQIKVGDNVLVFGGGAVGQITAALCRVNGAGGLGLVEPLAARRDVAQRRWGALAIDPLDGSVAEQVTRAFDGRWPDGVIETSGSLPGLRDALRCAGVAGTVIAAGFYAGSAALPLCEEFLHNRVTIKASMSVWGCPHRQPERWDRPRLLSTVLELMRSGRLDLSGFVTHRVPFARAQEAYQLIRDDPAAHLKIVLEYPDRP